MNLIKVLFTSVGSVIVLFILTKLMGDREMSQLSMFDFITAITIGSIAAEMATDLEEFMEPLIAMIVYALLSIAISYLNCKSIKFRRIMSGKSLVLLEEGKIYNRNMLKARLDINEFLTQCRNQGYFNIDNIQTAILEPNGKISFLPKASQRPVTPKDLNLTPPEDGILINVIIDGKILEDNLKNTGNDEKWLKKQLLEQGVHDLSEVFLASCNIRNNLIIYTKSNEKFTKDNFQ